MLCAEIEPVNLSVSMCRDGEVFDFRFADFPRASKVNYDSAPPLLKTVKGVL